MSPPKKPDPISNTATSPRSTVPGSANHATRAARAPRAAPTQHCLGTLKSSSRMSRIFIIEARQWHRPNYESLVSASHPLSSWVTKVPDTIQGELRRDSLEVQSADWRTGQGVSRGGQRGAQGCVGVSGGHANLPTHETAGSPFPKVVHGGYAIRKNSVWCPRNASGSAAGRQRRLLQPVARRLLRGEAYSVVLVDVCSPSHVGRAATSLGFGPYRFWPCSLSPTREKRSRMGPISGTRPISNHQPVQPVS